MISAVDPSKLDRDTVPSNLVSMALLAQDETSRGIQVITYQILTKVENVVSSLFEPVSIKTSHEMSLW